MEGLIESRKLWDRLTRQRDPLRHKRDIWTHCISVQGWIDLLWWVDFIDTPKRPIDTQKRPVDTQKRLMNTLHFCAMVNRLIMVSRLTQDFGYSLRWYWRLFDWDLNTGFKCMEHFRCMTRRSHMCDVTRSYMWRDVDKLVSFRLGLDYRVLVKLSKRYVYNSYKKVVIHRVVNSPESTHLG